MLREYSPNLFRAQQNRPPINSRVKGRAEKNKTRRDKKRYGYEMIRAELCQAPSAKTLHLTLEDQSRCAVEIIRPGAQYW
jgi:hypothetical protein